MIHHTVSKKADSGTGPEPCTTWQKRPGHWINEAADKLMIAFQQSADTALISFVQSKLNVQTVDKTLEMLLSLRFPLCSPVWKYFTMNENEKSTTNCKYCFAKVSKTFKIKALQNLPLGKTSEISPSLSHKCMDDKYSHIFYLVLASIQTHSDKVALLHPCLKRFRASCKD